VTRNTTIVYLHGFNSSPGSVKARKLERAAAALPSPPLVYIPQLNHQPARAMRDVCSWLDARNAREASAHAALTFVGSSLGGYYATWLAERYGARAIVINPAVRPFESLAAFRGAQHNPYTGERYELTAGHFDELSALRIERITCPKRYLLLMRSGDELLDWREPVAYYGGAWQFVAGGGDHGWEDIDAELPSILRFAGAEHR
jgi:uncharacterized protein